jgi:alpha-D-ribose 1-methylphosphonate 5-triphosphate synthase subunit PhnH
MLAFPEPALASQATFRALLDAFARPGSIMPVAPAKNPPPPLSGTVAALALTLLDYETPVWLDPKLAASAAVADWIRLHTGARLAASPDAAAFALIADPEHAPAFDTFPRGTAEYPDRSATLVLQVARLEVARLEVERPGAGQQLSLSGPGISGTQALAAAPLPVDFITRWAENRALFPCGIDLILAAPDAIAALPRSVTIATERG